MKKLLSIMLTVSILSVFCVPVGAVAPMKAEVTYDMIKSDSAVISVKKADISEDVLNVLSDNGADIDNETVIEVLSVNNSEDTAICVINIEEEQIEKDIYISMVEDENNNMVIDNSMADILAQGPDYDMEASYPPLSWDGAYMVHATATAALYYSGTSFYYKPYKCSFYYENYENARVDSIEVQYIADGFLYTYPGFVKTDDEEYVHGISVYKANPVAGVTYSNYNYFYEDKVLMTDSGSPFVGHFLTFFNDVNGEVDSYTVSV